MKRLSIRLLLFCIFLFSLRAEAETTLDELKAQLDSIKADYEERIKALESRIEELQIQMLQAPEPGPEVSQAPAQTSPGILNPAISIIGNFVGRSDSEPVFNEEGDEIDDKVNLRETELDFRVAVDPYADGVLITSIESEFPGEFAAGVEEGYVNIKKLPFWEQSPGGLKLKVGRFRPAFAKSNILHTHDLPTTFRSLPVEEFLGEEGFVQNGVSSNFFLPSFDESSSLDVTLEAMDGGDIALSPQSEARFSYLGHVRYFRSIQGGHDLELGWSSYAHPSGNEVGTASAHAVDFFYRWKPARQGQWKSYLLGGELMFAPDITAEQETSGTPLGYSVFTQWQFQRRLYAGLRYDQTDTLVNPELQRQSVTPYLTYYFSEFLRFRLNYEHRWSDLIDEDGRNSVFFELNWIFGSHPPEPYWVNK